MNKKRPKVGVCLCVVRDDKVLLHKRKGGSSDGVWSFPGGHLEFGESFEKGALRELAEEAGPIKTTKPELWTICNTIYKDQKKHYVVVVMKAEWIVGEAVIMEPKKCYVWDWFSWDDLPKPLMEGIKDLVKRDMNP